MADEEFKTIDQLLEAYKNGQRKFENWDFEEDGSIEGLNLTGIEFYGCFLFLNFQNANLSNSKFIECNIKTADFSGANLTNALIKNCAVESTTFKGSINTGFRFEENYAYGAIATQKDFDAWIFDV